MIVPKECLWYWYNNPCANDNSAYDSATIIFMVVLRQNSCLCQDSAYDISKIVLVICDSAQIELAKVIKHILQ
jgi:hypothetical protein